MMRWLGSLAEWLIAAPEALFLLLLGAAAGLENIVPPIPADVVVVIGAALAIAANADLSLVFLAVWVGNVAGALLVYAGGRRYGTTFFSGRIGQFLLRPAQLNAIARAYDRYGFPIIFLSRFLPVFRSVVPAFAGLSGVGFFRTAIPIATASAIWYGALVFAGATAGRNWQRIIGWLGSISTSAWIVAVVICALLFWVWWRTR